MLFLPRLLLAQVCAQLMSHSVFQLMADALVNELKLLSSSLPSRDKTLRLTPSVYAMLAAQWQQLRQEAQRLRILHNQLEWRGSALYAFIAPMRSCLSWACDKRAFPPFKLAASSSASNGVEKRLRLGLISPGTLGCMHISHLRLNLEPITNNSWGIFTAMRQLGIDVVGMPGARLPPNTQIHEHKDIRVYARGGPYYASCAMLWRNTDVSPIEDLGSNRRIIAKVNASCCIWTILLYLPPDYGTARDDEWLHELKGLHDDMRTLATRGIHPASHAFVVMGDINHQPRGLGGSGFANRRREHAWSSFLEEWGLVLNNPAVNDDSTHRVFLPIRQRLIHIRAGDTHHFQNVRARAIDVVASSTSANADVTIHNSVHCQSESSCRWQSCSECTLGDHFLIEINVDANAPQNVSKSSMAMPKWWHSVQRWKTRMNAATPLLRAITNHIQSLISDAPLKQACSGLSRVQADWLADVLGWLTTTVGAMVREGWVTPAGEVRRNSIKPSSIGGNPADPEWTKVLRHAMLTQAAAPDAVRKCLRMLRP